MSPCVYTMQSTAAQMKWKIWHLKQKKNCVVLSSPGCDWWVWRDISVLPIINKWNSETWNPCVQVAGIFTSKCAQAVQKQKRNKNESYDECVIKYNQRVKITKKQVKANKCAGARTDQSQKKKSTSKSIKRQANNELSHTPRRAGEQNKKKK